MESDDAFQEFGREIASDPISVLLAKWRRDAFIADLERLPDVAEVIPSGSLARGTQIGPVHDVDLIVVFNSSEHPDYGHGSESAQAAMDHLERSLLEARHPWQGAERSLLTETEQRRHVVTCSGVSTGPFEDIIPSAPPVDVMPAVRKDGHLRVPEDGDSWIDVDPEKFMRLVEERQREWKYFTEVIKMVKAWAEHNHLDIKNLAVEVMVLKYCPRPRFFQTLACGEALAQFFENAARAHITSLKDPAGWCGEIDPGMNYTALQSALGKAAGLARQAMNAEYALVSWFYAAEGVPDPDDLWGKLFGRKYPKAKERFWHAQVYEPWFLRGQAERAAQASWDGPEATRPGPPRPDGPDNPDPTGPDGPDKPPPDGPGGRGPRGPEPPGGGAAPGPGTRGSPQAPRHQPPGPRQEPTTTPDGPSTGPWPEVFGPGVVPVTVPLTFG
ncbi:MAG: nucleotidyltransferase domain-containing protein [Streptosporangiaceae bacterium]